MIKLTDEWFLESDTYCWKLKHKSRKPTYHRTLEQVAQVLLNEEAKTAETLNEIWGKIESMSKVILNNIGERK